MQMAKFSMWVIEVLKDMVEVNQIVVAGLIQFGNGYLLQLNCVQLLRLLDSKTGEFNTLSSEPMVHCDLDHIASRSTDIQKSYGIWIQLFESLNGSAKLCMATGCNLANVVA